MFALLMRPERHSAVLPGMELDQAAQDELRDVVTGFVSYFGTFTVDKANNTVTHHIQASLVPSWVGIDLKRTFRFENNGLVLTRVSQDGAASDRLIWDRLPE